MVRASKRGAGKGMVPEVEILMATYNGSRYIAEQIRSIQNQTYQNWKLLISDDCSSDNTVDIIRSIAASDNRIILVSHDKAHGGAVANFFSLIALSKGPYVMFSDQDDVWNNDKVEIALAALMSLEKIYGADEPLLVSTDVEVVDQHLETLSDSMFASEKLSYSSSFRRALVENNVIGCTAAANRSLIRVAQQEVPIHCIAMHDWWLNLLALSFGHCVVLNRRTMKYRQHDNNVVGASSSSIMKLINQFNLDNSLAYWKKTILQARTLLNSFSLTESVCESLQTFIELQTGRDPLSLIKLLRGGFVCSAPTRRLSQIILYCFYGQVDS